MVPTQELFPRLILIAGMVVAIGWFTFRARQLWSYAMLGRPQPRLDRLPERIGLFNKNVLGQFRLWNHYTAAGVAHAITFWGFLIIQIGALDLFLSGLWPGAHIPLVGATTWFMFVQDLAQAFVLVAIVSFFYRRYVTQPERLNRDPQGPIILALLVYLGYSKHLHLFTAPLNVFFYDLTPKGALPLVKDIEQRIENEEPLGASRVQDLSRKDILDLYTCTECGRCQDAC